MENVLGFSKCSSTFQLVNLIYAIIHFHSAYAPSSPSCRGSANLTSISSIGNTTEAEVICFRNPTDIQTIKSINYGSDYPNNYKRAYIIMGLKDTFITLQSVDFQLQSSDSEGRCKWDSVAVWDLKCNFVSLRANQPYETSVAGVDGMRNAR